MINPAAVHATSLGQLEALYGDACPSVKCNGVTVRCLSSTGMNSQQLALGGYDLETDRIVIIRKTDLNGQTFKLGWDMTFLPTGENYRINQIKTPMGEQQVHFGLVSQAKGAGAK